MSDALSTNNGPLPDTGEAGAEIMARADAIAVFNEAARGVTRKQQNTLGNEGVKAAKTVS